jgi:hypothetical protein
MTKCMHIIKIKQLMEELNGPIQFVKIHLSLDPRMMNLIMILMNSGLFFPISNMAMFLLLTRKGMEEVQPRN